MNTKDKLKDLLMEYFSIGDSYSYNLTRVKSAFAVGTVSLGDKIDLMKVLLMILWNIY